MKKIVDFNEISKEKLYELYIKEVKKNEALEAKYFKLELELADKVKKLEEANFQLVQRNKTLFGKKREINNNDQNDFNEAENGETTENNKAKEDLEHFNLKVRTMGRGYEQDTEFFEAASTAAYYLMEVCNGSRRENHK